MTETNDPKGQPVREDEPFRLTRGWLVVGIVALLVGIASGIVMSSATFVR